MATAEDIITDAFIELGIMVAWGDMAPADKDWGRRKFNSFLKTVSVDGVDCFTTVEEAFTLTPGTEEYTIGTGGDFDTARPNSIKKAFIRISDYDYPVEVRPINEYWGITQKETAGRPVHLYYQSSAALGTIYLYYVPDAAESLWIVSYKPLTTYDVKATEVTVPGEYEEMFVSNLAVRMASRYGRPISRELKERAINTLAAIHSQHVATRMEGVNLNIIGNTSGYDVNLG